MKGIPSLRYALRLFVILRCDNRVKFPNLCSSLFPSESCEVLFSNPSLNHAAFFMCYDLQIMFLNRILLDIVPAPVYLRRDVSHLPP